MDVALAVGGCFLSTFLQVAFDRIGSSRKFIEFFQGKSDVEFDEDIFDRLEITLDAISVVLEDAEDKQAKSPAVRRWLGKLKDAANQADDLLDELNTEFLRLKVDCEFQLKEWNVRRNESDMRLSLKSDFMEELMANLKKITDRLEYFVKQIHVLGLQKFDSKERYTYRAPSSSVVNESEIVGREDEKEKLVQMVLSDGRASDVSVIPITGLGGVGKTTLAQLVYNDDRVKSNFSTRAWICVSEEYDPLQVTKTLLMEVNSGVVDDKDDFNRVQVKLRDSLAGKQFLVILDDIWNENYNDWHNLKNPLNHGRRGSKIIITTRNENIALMVQNERFHRMKPIPQDKSWDLFKLHAFDNGDHIPLRDFEIIGEEIVKKCNGLPLAVRAVAGALRPKQDINVWRDTLNSDIWSISDIEPALSLSYKHLPSHLKCCFSFLAVFPKDIPFDKEEVVLLWMANDFVQPSRHKSLQEVGRDYFEDLRSRSLLEVVNGDKYSMHDLVNDLARYVSGKFCVRLQDYQDTKFHQRENNLPAEVLHFSYSGNHYVTSKSLEGLAQAKGLRTFLPIQSQNITTLFFSHILPRFKRIRALTLSQSGILVVPDLIGDMKHLRFFNLSGTKIRNLPSAISKCLNLQTLIVSKCYYLEGLPEDMRHLINLQHLDVRGVGDAMIKSMDGWLSILKDTQNLCIVADKVSGGALEHLGILQPCPTFEIIGLENAVTVGNIKQVELKDEDCIEYLILKWSGMADCSKDELNIFSKLQPHTNTTRLRIEGYRGTTFSNWLGDSAFSKMEYVCLRDCKNCFFLPPLGQLTTLKTLEIRGMDGITVVGEEFYGNSSSCKPFQALEKLSIYSMKEWVMWYAHSDVDFPSLKEFTIMNCPKLVGEIPCHITSLKKFKIRNLPNLHYDQEGCLPCSPWLEVASILDLPSLKKMPQEINHLDELEVGRCPSLVLIPNHVDFLNIEDCSSISLLLQSVVIKCLFITRCQNVEFPTNDGGNSCLENLRIYDCADSVEAIPVFPFNKLRDVYINKFGSPKLFKFPNGCHQTLTALQSLEICNCNNMLSFPEEGLPAPNLKKLRVVNCMKLNSLPEQMNTQLSSLYNLEINTCPEIEWFPEGGLPSSLERLLIGYCYKLKSLPEKMHKLSSLRDLWISDCFEIECFPEGGLPFSLESLSISGCKNLKSFPQGGLPSSLVDLDISDCQKLKSFPQGGLPSSLVKLDIRNCKELMNCRRSWCLQSLMSLTDIHIKEVEDTVFPEEGLLPSSLQHLHIWQCPNLEALNHKGLQHLSSLQSITILYCPNLKYLPEEKLSSSLFELNIRGSPKLKERMEREEGGDWHKVCHIPLIIIDDEAIS